MKSLHNILVKVTKSVQLWIKQDQPDLIGSAVFISTEPLNRRAPFIERLVQFTTVPPLRAKENNISIFLFVKTDYFHLWFS